MLLLSRKSVQFAFLLLSSASSFSLIPTFAPQRSARLFATSSPDNHNKNDPRHTVEFTNLEPLPENDRRKQRLERDMQLREQFVNFGDELWELRSKMDSLSARLVQAIKSGSADEDVENTVRDALRQAEQQDPELVYMLELAEYKDAVLQGQKEEALGHYERAMAARAVLPQFNLDGLWVGKYGSHGYELINVTYVGDTLIGVKVTGDRNVPRGEISFQVDLNPLKSSKSLSDHASFGGSSAVQDHRPLQPIQLTDQAARKWGTSQLPRYPGLGQVAEEGFINHQWMDGQLIIIGEEYFSFAWLPIEQQIFFGRPSPELALKMLRESGIAPFRSTTDVFEEPPTVNDDVRLQRDFVMRCLEKTHEHEDDVTGGLLEADPMGCIWHDESEECYFQ